MPFSPLPGIFSDDLVSRAGTGVLELGSGHGAFTELLRSLGHHPVTLDLAGPWRGVHPHIVCDALRPAVGGRFGVVVAANLLRHVWPEVRERGLQVWHDLVAPGGVLWLLEDEPMNEPPAARNYRRLQDLLSRLQPGEHRPLLAAADFLRARSAWRWSGSWTSGTLVNGWPGSADNVVAMLRAGRPQPGGEVATLVADIERDGIAYGSAWWARWEPEASS